MKSILRLFSAALVCLLAFTSCSSDNDSDTVTQQSFPDFFASVEDLSSGAQAVYSNMGFSVELNYTKMTAVIKISGLRLPDGTSYPTMTLQDIPWSIDNSGWKVIKGTNLVPSDAISPALSFNSFEFKICERILDNDGQAFYSPGVCVRFTIDSKYRILSSYTPQQLYGTATSVSAADNSSFSSTATEYIVKYNTDTRLLTIVMNNARFASTMPMALNIELRNIPVSVRGTAFEFNVDAITPYIGETPFEAFPITALNGSFDPGKGLDFTFHCAPRTTQDEYNTTVTADYSHSPGIN